MNVCLYVQELSFELMYKKQPLLLKNTDINCTVWRANMRDIHNRSPNRLPFPPKYNFFK